MRLACAPPAGSALSFTPAPELHRCWFVAQF